MNILEGNTLALNQLDWDDIIAPLIAHAHFDYNKNLFQLPPKKKNFDEVEFVYDSIEFFTQFVLNAPAIIPSILQPLAPSESYYDTIQKLEKYYVLDAKSLNFVALMIESFQTVLEHFDQSPLFKNNPSRIINLTILKKKFLIPLRQFIDKEGHVKPEQHPVLGTIYREILNLEVYLRQRITQISREKPFNDVIQFSEFDIINDRYCLAIRSDSYSYNLGPIISRSQSGMTVFVEPIELREKSNHRIVLLSQFDELLAKLFQELSNVLTESYQTILSLVDIYHHIDEYFTRATYCLNKKLKRPTINREDDFDISINNFFHPLIQNCVRNSLDLDSKTKGLIISGPNTGGKTVCLKSIILAHIFPHYGLYIASNEAKINLADGIFYFGNDQQNLPQGLSSFSSEAKNYLTLLNSLQKNNLIIIDEIFNSTSSEEASALALAFLNELFSFSVLLHNSKVIISTHHQFLKTQMHTNNHYISAHMSYDAMEARPTYKIEYGIPGSSLACDIFKQIAKINAPEFELIGDNAKKILDKKQLSYEELLENLSQKQLQLNKLYDENTQINIELKNQRNSMQGLLLLEKQTAFTEYKNKIQMALNEAESLLRRAKQGEINGIRQFNLMASHVNSQLNKSAAETTPAEQFNSNYSKVSSSEEIIIGKTYFSTLLKKNVKVLKIDERNKMATCIFGMAKIQCPLDSLMHNSSMSKGNVFARKQPEKINLTHFEGPQLKLEYDCRGYRLDQFTELVEKVIDGLYFERYPYVNIIHGHGDGILKNWLRDRLKSSPEIEATHPTGNDGSTQLALKKS